jgi:hypothetical protein
VHACQVQQVIDADANSPPQFAWAGQNISAIAMLLCNLPEPVDPQQQDLHRNMQTLVKRAAIQHAESSMSRH